jgi:cell wall assembly regulator SMI1
MTHGDVDQIERELGIKVPADYRAVVTNYPAPDAAKDALYDHPTYVIDDNRRVREGPLWGVNWPTKYLVVGADGSGGIYCIEVERQQSPVIYFDHDDRSFYEEAPNLQEWVTRLINEYTE